YVQNVDNILLKEQPVYPPSPHIKPANRLEPGNHTWRFCFELGTPVMESIQGLSHASLRYIVEGEVSMKRLVSSNLRASQNFQVIRGIDVSLAGDRSSEQQKQSGSHSCGLEYQVRAPPVLHRWGEPIDFEFRLIPLASYDIKLGIARFELREKLNLQATFDKRLVSNVNEVSVMRGEKDLSGEPNEFHVRFPLSHSLKICRQSVRESRIQISHRIHIEIEFADGDDRLGQIALDFPFELVFPPNITFDEAGNGCFDRVRSAPIRDGESLLAAPPAFGKHYQDELYTHDD
ncbi:uncharacterized protein A1O9_11650, partial [Exophiala aquamarina CBS 119918]